MMNKTKNTNAIEHEGKELVYTIPVYTGSSHSIQNSVAQNRLRLPTIAELVSIIHNSYISKDKHSRKVMRLLRGSFQLDYGKTFVSSTGVYTIPKKGVYFQDYCPFGEDGLPVMNLSDLEDKFKEDCSSIKFIPGLVEKYPISFHEGKQFGGAPTEYSSPCKSGTFNVGESQRRNDFLLILLGEKGMKKLRELARCEEGSPYLEVAEYLLGKDPGNPRITFAGIGHWFRSGGSDSYGHTYSDVRGLKVYADLSENSGKFVSFGIRDAEHNTQKR